MRPTERTRNDLAVDRLTRLAEALKKRGVTADLIPDRRPFPGLAVRPPWDAPIHVDSPHPTDVIRIPAGTVMILAGRAHYWRQRPNGDLQLIEKKGRGIAARATPGRPLDLIYKTVRLPSPRTPT